MKYLLRSFLLVLSFTYRYMRRLKL